MKVLYKRWDNDWQVREVDHESDTYTCPAKYYGACDIPQYPVVDGFEAKRAIAGPYEVVILLQKAPEPVKPEFVFRCPICNKVMRPRKARGAESKTVSCNACKVCWDVVESGEKFSIGGQGRFKGRRYGRSIRRISKKSV